MTVTNPKLIENILYKKALKYIFGQLPMFHRIGAAAYKNNLDNTLALSRLTGQPELRFPSIHIAGTNGKGSVANMLASVLQEAGFKTGLFTSPHLKDFRERMRINGEMIPKKDIGAFIEKYQSDFEAIQPSFFELTFAMAMQYFADAKVDIAVVETGMGGRLDSTNIVRPVLSIITNISYDHMQYLGDTLPLIAAEKAGIIKSGVAVVIGKWHPVTNPVFEKTAADKNTQVVYADQIYKATDFTFSCATPFGSFCQMRRRGVLAFKDVYCPLSGEYQQENLQTVFAAAYKLNQLGYAINETLLREGIANVVINTGFAGRWQVLNARPLVIADTAHNVAGLEWVVKQLKSVKRDHIHFVLGMVGDKDIRNIMRVLPDTATYYYCKPNIPRGCEAARLAMHARRRGLTGSIYPSVKDAYQAAYKAASKTDLVFVGGSTFVVAEVV
ncbi:MAG: folylpolyglutamate synthase/dihydrofolate synthase family protein [Bacteroidota bacterium]